MKQLTYKELELLHYALHMFMEDSNNKEALYPLHNKLIAMRAELEYPHSDIHLSLEEINNSL